jgi:hypothetical protein
MSNFFQNLGTGQNMINLKSMLGIANENAPVDQKANTAIEEAKDQVPVDNSVEEYSEDTVALQKELIEQGYGEHLGDSQADGFLGPKTRMAMQLRDKDAAEKVLEQDSLSNKQDLLNQQGRGGITQDSDGWQIPVYAAPKGNRFS